MYLCWMQWDAVFHMSFVTEVHRRKYLTFLKTLLKGKAYVSLVYMTGILPIAKYSSGSELNMFLEYSMASQARFSEYFGFTEEEVDEAACALLQEGHGEACDKRGAGSGMMVITRRPGSVCTIRVPSWLRWRIISLEAIGRVLGHMMRFFIILSITLQTSGMPWHC